MVDNKKTVNDNDLNDTSDTEIQVASAKFAKIPEFWSNRPDLWFLRVEAQFRNCGITTSQTKYDYLVASLSSSSMEIIADFLIDPGEGNKYDNIKKLLISRCQDTEERRLDALLNKIEIGDLKPSELYRQMETLAGGNSLINKPLLNKLWLNKLPALIQPCIIAIEDTHSQSDIFRIADRMFDSSDRPRISAIQNQCDNELKDVIIKLTKRIDSLESQNGRNRSRTRSQNSNSQSRSSRSKSRTKFNKNKNNDYCWYHSRYGSNAHRCIKGCTYSPKPNSDDPKN